MQSATSPSIRNKQLLSTRLRKLLLFFPLTDHALLRSQAHRGNVQPAEFQLVAILTPRARPDHERNHSETNSYSSPHGCRPALAVPKLTYQVPTGRWPRAICTQSRARPRLHFR